MTLKKLHYTSGLLLTLFIGIHLFNHLCSLGGIESHIAVMKTLRPFYRNILVESLVLAAVVLQILSGLKLFIGTRSAASRAEKLQRWTGLYMAIFVVIHVSSVLVGRFVLHLDTNFYYGTAGLNTFPFSLFFVPYYGLASLSFFGHLAAIHRQKMQYSFLGWTPGKQAIAILTLGFLLTAAMFYGLTNRFRGVSVPAAYHVLIGK
ncbi:hypothetical protein [Pedobacter sp. SYSU D00535]|uniref:hypothetical protein n=1 Tax=Pedobacter sp. SYSU D00535 TaxID=2810308 RepID=UPI001A97133B|nr:hypothetical protein [Pedobacter sp. SYSU D00535]